eukprot:TRINITY_DN67850_c0_g1_i1.p1 TRINITY_DN67850_c0_g1~~TRINITY_DN67850_c0_g1_i1.p1  ORF type:complete len:671 (+),score=60.29 TRINITY_DN67850_c0_g1_i1:92-2104(+)
MSEDRYAENESSGVREFNEDYTPSNDEIPSSSQTKRRARTRRSRAGNPKLGLIDHRAINRNITTIADQGHVMKLFDVIFKHMLQMNGINLATAFHRVAKLAARSFEDAEAIRAHPVFERLLGMVVQHVTSHSLRSYIYKASQQSIVAPFNDKSQEMPVQCLSIVSWSCASLRLKNQELLDCIIELVIPRLEMLKPFEVTNVAWAYSKLAMQASDLFRSISALMMARKPGEFTPQCLSTLAWSFATSGERDSAVFASIATELERNTGSMKTQEISNTLWAFAKNHCADVVLFDTLGSSALQNNAIVHFKAQELSNSVWAYATVSASHPPFFRAVAHVAISRRFEMVPQNFANILWAYAKLLIEPETLMVERFLEVSVTRLHEHKRRELSTLVWSASALCPKAAFFFDAAASFCCRHLASISTVALSNLVKDLSGTTMCEPEHFLELLRHSCEMLKHQGNSALVSTTVSGVRGALTNPSFDAYTTYLESLNEMLMELTAIMASSKHQLNNREGNAWSRTSAHGPGGDGYDTYWQDEDEDVVLGSVNVWHSDGDGADWRWSASSASVTGTYDGFSYNTNSASSNSMQRPYSSYWSQSSASWPAWPADGEWAGETHESQGQHWKNNKITSVWTTRNETSSYDDDIRIAGDVGWSQDAEDVAEPNVPSTRLSLQS